MRKPLKILYLHLSREKNIEYEDHELFARHAGADDIEAHFIRQWKTADAPRRGPRVVQEGRLRFTYTDFGRDLSLRPRPGKLRRAWMMARRLPAAARLIWKSTRSFQPDFIYTSQQRFDVLAARVLRRLTGIPHVMHVHYQAGPWLGRLVFDELRRTPYLITCSRFNQEKITHWGVPIERVPVCPNPVNVAKFDILPEPEYVREQFSIPAGVPVIVYAGRLDPYKHAEVVIQAFAKAIHAYPDARLLLCGESFHFPDYDRVLHRMVEDLHLSERVIFAGFRSDLPKIFSGCDIFCLPSESEIFGMAIGEAMVSGLPVLSVWDGAIPDLVAHGETGLLSPLNDADGLAENMLRLLDDPALARRMGQAGRSRIFTHFTPQISGPQWMAIMRGFKKA